MPQLLRLRYVRVGHREARADDVTIPFMLDGRPTHSTLWLKNGGGKSSLLSLFFSLLVPDQRKFLGAIADGGDRVLADYVRRDEAGLVAAEWLLDRAGGDLGVLEQDLLITGTALEWATPRGGGDAVLERLFFSWVAPGGRDDLRLEVLPTVGAAGGPITLRELRQEVQGLRQREALSQPFVTDHQREWVSHLEACHLDPVLFEAQALMNQGEGEAERLFTTFRTEADYLRFFLDRLLRPASILALFEGLRKHRKVLEERQTLLLPEQELVAGLEGRLAPLMPVREQRELRAQAVSQALGEAQALEQALAAREQDADERRIRAESDIAEQTRAADAEAAAAKAARLEATGAERWLADRVLSQAREAERAAKQEHGALYRTQRLWGAAIHLRELRRHQAELRLSEETLEARQQEHRPLLDQVRTAASQLAAAIDHASAATRVEKAAADTAEAEANREEAAARTVEGEAQRAVGQAASAVTAAREGREQAERELRQLRGQGDVGPAEDPLEATQRLDAAMRAAVAELETCGRERTRCRSEREAAVQAADAAERAEREAGRVAGERKQALEQAEQAAARLNGDRTLAAFLELEEGHLDIRRLDTTVPARLRDEARRAHEQLLSGHVQLKADERAVEHLDVHGVLPPTPEVERLLAGLAGRGLRVWDGWRYLKETMALADARALMHRAPAIATGLVVEDDDLAAAVAAAAPLAADLDDPVLLMPASRVAGAEDTAGVVVGAGDDAHLSPEAGERTAAVRQARLRSLVRAQEGRAARERDAERLAMALADWQTSYPPEWWRTETDALASWTGREQDARSRRLEARQRQEDADRTLEEIGQRERKHRDARAAAQVAHARVKAWRDRYPEGVERFRRQEAAAEEALRRGRTEAEEAKARGARAREQRDQAQQRRIAAQSTLERYEIQRQAIKHLPSGPVVARGGDLVSLTRAHELALREYEGAVGVDVLQERAETARRNITDARRQLTQACQQVTEAEVVATLDSAADPGQAERMREQAVERAQSIAGGMSQLGKDVKDAEGKADAAKQAWEAAGGMDLAPPLDPNDEPAARRQAEAARVREVAAMGREREARDLLQLAEGYRDEALKAHTAAHAAREQLQTTIGGLDRLARTLNRAARPGAPDVAATLAANETACRARLNDLGRLVTRENEALDRLNAERDQLHRRVLDWCGLPQFTAVEASVAAQIRQFSAAQLEAQVQETLERLALRAQHLAGALEDADRDRALLIGQVLQAATEGAASLAKLARYSTIPERIPVLGGHTLLQCEYRLPEAEEERRERIGRLLDRYARENEIPGAGRFLEEAVQALAGSIRLRILRPSLERDGGYEGILALGKFSGGEKLTVATMLYCALANTRARELGRQRDPTGVLLMDNPFGKASRAGFIKLQISVADQLGIQLIYLTGIIDYEALNCFPNLVRLGNRRLDRRTGEKIIEVLDKATADALLNAVQIGRRPPAVQDAAAGLA